MKKKQKIIQKLISWFHKMTNKFNFLQYSQQFDEQTKHGICAIKIDSNCMFTN